MLNKHNLLVTVAAVRAALVDAAHRLRPHLRPLHRSTRSVVASFGEYLSILGQRSHRGRRKAALWRKIAFAHSGRRRLDGEEQQAAAEQSTCELNGCWMKGTMI